jgi:hypothetical protein
LESVSKFAEDKKAYHETFKTAFVKLCELGHNVEKLDDMENFLHDDPRSKLRFDTVY